MREFSRGSDDNPIQRSFTRSIGQILNRVVTRQGDDAASVSRYPSREFPDELPACPRVYREMAVEALEGRIQNSRVYGLAMRQNQGRNLSFIFGNRFEYQRCGGWLFQIGRNGKNTGPDRLKFIS